MTNQKSLVWHRVLDAQGLDEGRVISVTADSAKIALSRMNWQYGAVYISCSNQRGSFGEGSIEKGVENKCWLRCSCHGSHFGPLTRQSPGSHGDGLQTFPVKQRDYPIYVRIVPEPTHKHTITDVLAQLLVYWNIKQVFGMVGQSWNRRCIETPRGGRRP